MTGTEYVCRDDVVTAVAWDGKPETANAFVGDSYGVDWEYERVLSTDILVATPAGWDRAREGDWLARDAFGNRFVIPKDETSDYVPYRAVEKPAGDEYTAAQVVAAALDAFRREDPVRTLQLLKLGPLVGGDPRLPDDLLTDATGRFTLLAILNFLLRRLGDEVVAVDLPRGATGEAIPAVSAVRVARATEFQPVEAAGGEEGE